MKKLFFMAALGVAGLMSASNNLPTSNNLNDSNKVDQCSVSMTCLTYGIYLACTDTDLSDTVCWSEGTDTTYKQAMRCMRENAKALADEACPEDASN